MIKPEQINVAPIEGSHVQIIIAQLGLNYDDMALLFGCTKASISSWTKKGVSGARAALLRLMTPTTTYQLKDPKTGKGLGRWVGVSFDAALAGYLATQGYDGRTYKFDERGKLSISSSQHGCGLNPDVDAWDANTDKPTLTIIHGALNDMRLHIAHNEDVDESNHGDFLKDEFFDGWQQVSLKMTTNRGARYFRIEPSEEEGVLNLPGEFEVTGRFTVVEKINNMRKAGQAYHRDVQASKK